MDKEYEQWKANPSQEALQNLVGAAKGDIDTALKMYAGNQDPAARSHAKVLAVKAFRSYDPSKGTKLRTHFLNQLQPLRRFAASRRVVTHIPETVQQDMAGLNEATNTLMDKFEREPTDAELSDYTGLSIRRLHDLRRRRLSVSESSRVTPEGEPMEDETQRTGDLDDWTAYVYHDLNPVDRKIFEWKTGWGGHPKLSVQEIAKRLRLTSGAVSQRSNKISERIQEGLKYVD